MLIASEIVMLPRSTLAPQLLHAHQIGVLQGLLKKTRFGSLNRQVFLYWRADMALWNTLLKWSTVVNCMSSSFDPRFVADVSCSAKYGLVATKQILDFCGNNSAIGHDIGCASRVTIMNSELGERARETDLRVVVNAFHGFAHNRLCQLQNHPLYLLGFGNKDLDMCERIFSSSNSSAPLIRHASYFHWKQFLDLHFDQWDSDKYLELSRKFLICYTNQFSHTVRSVPV